MKTHRYYSAKLSQNGTDQFLQITFTPTIIVLEENSRQYIRIEDIVFVKKISEHFLVFHTQQGDVLQVENADAQLHFF